MSAKLADGCTFPVFFLLLLRLFLFVFSYFPFLKTAHIYAAHNILVPHILKK